MYSFRFFLKILPEFLVILFFCSTFALAIFKQTRFIIASFIGLWCNGNTADFGSVVLGSSPSRPTNKTIYIYRLIGLWCNGNTADFGSVVLGSSPSRPTTNIP